MWAMLCIYKGGAATQHLQGKKNSKSHSGPITAAFEDQFHAWTAVLLHHQHWWHIPSLFGPVLRCATACECYCNTETATGRRLGRRSRAAASATAALKPPVGEAACYFKRGICYGPASSTKTGHLSPGFSSQLGYHVTALGLGARRLCLWVSQGLGTTQVRSQETGPHGLTPHGEVCINRERDTHTLHLHRAATVLGRRVDRLETGKSTITRGAFPSVGRESWWGFGLHLPYQYVNTPIDILCTS